MNDDQLRIGDEEREQAAAELADHYARGRLTVEEHGDRLDRIWAARTRGDLAPIFRDLPGRHGPRSAPAPWGDRGDRRTPGRRRGIPTPLLVVLAVLLVITVLTHLPIILIGLLVWCVFISKARRHDWSRRW